MGWITRKVPAPLADSARVVVRLLTRQPQLGAVRFGDLRSTAPVSRHFGTDRGGAVDRYYIEQFLDVHRRDVGGRVLEVGDDGYTRRFGDHRVVTSDILHATATNPDATIVADLADAPQIPDRSFDCVILTQTLQYVFNPPAAVATLHRILRPGGVLLMTVPGITPAPHRGEFGPSWSWSFTDRAVRRLLTISFPEGAVEVRAWGNVLAATAQLHGIGVPELTRDELDHSDPDYAVIVAARAVKAAGV
jgi:SAM-dependent methyltransferase